MFVYHQVVILLLFNECEFVEDYNRTKKEGNYQNDIRCKRGGGCHFSFHLWSMSLRDETLFLLRGVGESRNNDDEFPF